ncbi:DNA-formamidopyrimidine glycosylase family protein [Mucilaginibacter ginsenosidivorax]|uniref:Formamidopyrimidine-DNA glycosylase n=1 Tax=Mucilaginibacter ginsenosidivorax TaxID=862126 RepID=A0A5B8VSX0_9SPHI|nr:DNA-formamidopyrimidine glycosylase family protein [Mucilaginibacter ginsenosidivorax]QEC74697.1 formamidopyrimidine-DNA glycosylase [Mucilaginibacter ginsenosidivorax]
MAELPDLTVFAQILTRRFKGKVLETVDVTVAKKLNVTTAQLKSALEGHELTGVSREGKTLQFHFDGGQVLGLHLMLRGELISLDGDKIPRFQVMAFHFKGGGGFAVVDLQKAATPTLQPKPAAAPDALQLEKDTFINLLAKKRSVIKTLLMDPKVMRGIGNSYTDEILYHSHISPFSIANAIPEKYAVQLFKSMRMVLEKAIADIAEANGDELTGELRNFMAIHNPALKKTAKGEEILKDKIGGRTTYYTKAQELFV